MKVYMEQGILQENARQAEENRALFGKTLVVSLIGSPGWGKRASPPGPHIAGMSPHRGTGLHNRQSIHTS